MRNLENWFAKSNYLHTNSKKKIQFSQYSPDMFETRWFDALRKAKQTSASGERRCEAIAKEVGTVEAIGPRHMLVRLNSNLYSRENHHLVKDISEKQWIIEFFSRFNFFSFPRWMLLIFFSALSIRIFFCMSAVLSSAVVGRDFYFIFTKIVSHHPNSVSSFSIDCEIKVVITFNTYSV